MSNQALVNLTFHGIGSAIRPMESGEDRVWLDRDAFCAALDKVAGRDDIVITFDDGNISDVELALPALIERKLKAAFFVLAGKMDQRGYLDAKAIRTLEQAGMTIGNHGMHHRAWPSLSDEQLHEELVVARQKLEEVIGHRVGFAACPFGAYNRRVLRHLRECGYDRVFSSDRGAAKADAWFQPRNTLRPDNSRQMLEGLLAGGDQLQPGFARKIKLAVKRWI